MKKFLLFVFLFFSSESFAIVICINDSSADSCLEDGDSNGGSTEGVNCYYNKDFGVTQCNTALGDGSVAGYWDPKTFSCSNLVAPVVDAAGDLTCPPTKPVTIKSTSTPDPSKDDASCDPTKAPDPNNPDVGCASQKTLAKTNDLISESNSKLGAISGGTVANTGLLREISSTLKNIASQGESKDCPPSEVSAPSCPSGQVAGYFNGQFTCVSNSGISCTGDECRSVIVSKCGVSNSNNSDNDSIVSTTSKSVSFSKNISGSNTSCPSPETFSILSGNYEFSYEPVCNFLDSIRGLVVAMGALSALLIVVTAL